MAYPNFPGKHDEAPLVRPEVFREYLRSVGNLPTVPIPETVILSYQTRLLEHVRENHAGRR